jgi:hypothetical protein
MTYPHLTEADCGTLRLHVNARKSVLIGSLAEAEAIRSQLTKAAQFFRDQERHEAELADRQVARDMNQANAVEHLASGGTMRGFTSLPSRQTLEGGAA